MLVSSKINIKISDYENKPQQKNVADLNVEGLLITTNTDKAKVLADRLEQVFRSEVDPKYKVENFNEINEKINTHGVDSMYDEFENSDGVSLVSLQ